LAIVAPGIVTDAWASSTASDQEVGSSVNCGTTALGVTYSPDPADSYDEYVPSDGSSDSLEIYDSSGQLDSSYSQAHVATGTGDGWLGGLASSASATNNGTSTTLLVDYNNLPAGTYNVTYWAQYADLPDEIVDGAYNISGKGGPVSSTAQNTVPDGPGGTAPTWIEITATNTVTNQVVFNGLIYGVGKISR